MPRDVIPCDKLSECNWPACPPTCKGRPGRLITPDIFDEISALAHDLDKGDCTMPTPAEIANSAGA